MDPTTIVALAAPAVEMLSKLLTKGPKKPLAEEAQAILQADPGSQVRIRRLFETAKNRLRSTWTIGMFMTVALFVLFAGMALAAVITGLVSGKSTFSIVFGGASAASLFTVILRLQAETENNRYPLIGCLCVAYHVNHYRENWACRVRLCRLSRV